MRVERFGVIHPGLESPDYIGYNPKTLKLFSSQIREVRLSSRSTNHPNNNRRVAALFGALLLACLAALVAWPALAAPPEPDPTPTPLINPRMAEPVVPANPTLAEQGALVYWKFCLACHGDQGQGLTEEYRLMAFGEDNNCWASKCHGPSHPPEGFSFPRVVPAMVGASTMQRFVTAAELQKYIFENMPWWNKGSLSMNEAWALTAILLQRNQILPKDVDLNPEEAGTVSVHLQFHSRSNERIGQGILFASLGLLVLALVIAARLKPVPATQAIGGSKRRPSFMAHLHPPTIPLAQARWRYTLAAGGMAIFLSLVLVITGILEMFFYIPTTEQAGASIQVITFLVPFGSLVRGIHFWAAQALVIVAAVHMLRVIFTGAYSPPRRFNYLLGLILLVVVLFFDFTGYVLRWDEGIRWALMVCTNLLKTIPQIGTQIYGFVVGGSQPGLATLTRFYTWHIFGLTLIMLIFIAWHIFRVRRDGGISAPPPELRADPRRITRFELVRREVLAMLVTCALLVLIGSLIPPPLAVPIRESAVIPLDNVQAPWFFLWVQYLLRFGDAFWLGVALPLGILAILVAVPYIFPSIPADQQGRWFPQAGRAAQIIAACLTLALLALTILELLQ
jgi:quinol-cytochrome oxidoreductase complex cytochrome b subunit